MDRYTIADCSFLQYTKSCSLGGENMGIPPTYFEWEPASAQDARFVTDSFVKDAKGEGQVCILLESFFLHPENYFAATQKPFDYVLTHNQYFADNFGWLWYAHGGSWVNLDSWRIHNKTKRISVLLSNKQTMPGHKMFHKVVERLGDKVDVFGLQSRVTKKEALSNYMYSIVIEAEICDYFFSEKLLDCFALGTIPIYRGCPGIGKFFNKRAIVQFDDLDDLEGVVERANSPEGEEWYLHHQNEITENIELAREYSISEDWIFKNYPFLFG